MNYIKSEDIKAYVEQNPTGIAGMSEALAAMVNHFAESAVRECANVLDPKGEYTEKYKYSHTPGPDGLRQVLSQQQYIEMLASKKIKEHFGVEE